MGASVRSSFSCSSVVAMNAILSLSNQYVHQASRSDTLRRVLHFSFVHAPKQRPQEQRPAWPSSRKAVHRSPRDPAAHLLAPIAETHRHRNHANDHGERGHQHGPEPRAARLQGGGHGVPMLVQLRFSERDDEDAVGLATPMHMIAPINAGTLSVVCVKKRTSTMPAKAAGSAVMITNGPSQD